MDDPPAGPVQDGLLALTALGALLDTLRRRDALRALRSPGAVLVGTAGAAGIEALVLRYPDRTRALWGRPVVRVVGLLGTVLGGRTLARHGGVRTAAALCWGLLAYLLLVGLVLAGRENPVARLVGPAAW